MPVPVHLTAATPPPAQSRIAVETRSAADRPNTADLGGLSVDANGQLVAPPSDPGDESRIATDPSGVAAKCEAVQSFFDARLHSHVVRAVISRSERWGVVWRADYAVGAAPSNMWRTICWEAPGEKQVSIVLRPLRMFDPSQSVKPLEGGPLQPRSTDGRP